MRVGGLFKVGLVAIVVAMLGWAITAVAGMFAGQPDTIEDLTPAWTAAGATPLDRSATVSVPPGQTLVAFLVGTDLVSIAGTTSGTCSATAGGEPIELSWPVQINPSVTGVLTESQQIVDIAGWSNTGNTAVNVQIICGSSDSTVEHFVAVPTRTGTLPRDPWFQPWGWLALGISGVVAVAIGVTRSRR